MIEVRDSAVWLVHLAAGHATGIFNASGNPLPFPEDVRITQSATGDVQFHSLRPRLGFPLDHPFSQRVCPFR